MLEQDKPTTTIPESPAQRTLNKIDHRDQFVRAVEIALLIAVVTFNIFLSVRLQQVIDSNQADTLQARTANIERQQQLEGYIKCVLLIRYDVPPESLTTKEGAAAALDSCASANKQ
jgi:hypothetical protein